MSWGIPSHHHGLNYWNFPNIYKNRRMTWRILGVSPHFRKAPNESIHSQRMSRAGIGTNRQVSVAGQLEVPVSPDLAVEVSQEFEMISGSAYTIKLTTGWGPRWIAFSCFIKWLNSMFYGRYNELVFMVVTIPYAPWCWYIYLQNWVILGKGTCWQMLVNIPAPWFAYGNGLW